MDGRTNGFGGRMSREDEYRRHAAALLDLAKRASNDHDKKRLLVISEAWLNLADKLSRMAGRRQATESARRRIKPRRGGRPTTTSIPLVARGGFAEPESLKLRKF